MIAERVRDLVPHYIIFFYPKKVKANSLKSPIIIILYECIFFKKLFLIIKFNHRISVKYLLIFNVADAPALLKQLSLKNEFQIYHYIGIKLW